MSHKQIYTVSRDKSDVWYAHKTGLPSIPVFGSISLTKKNAQKHAAACMGLTLEEYLKFTVEGN